MSHAHHDLMRLGGRQGTLSDRSVRKIRNGSERRSGYGGCPVVPRGGFRPRLPAPVSSGSGTPAAFGRPPAPGRRLGREGYGRRVPARGAAHALKGFATLLPQVATLSKRARLA